MKLSKKAIEAMTTKARTRIALEMDCSVYTVDRWIKENEDNGDLTKASVVKLLSEELEMDEDKILVSTPVKA